MRKIGKRLAALLLVTLLSFGLLEKRPVPGTPRLMLCCADNDSAVTVLPDGRLGKCEHFGDQGAFGSIYEDCCDEALCSAWKERYPLQEECRHCAKYPYCIRLKNCGGTEAVCSEQSRRIWLDRFRRQMLFTVERINADRRRNRNEA